MAYTNVASDDATVFYLAKQGYGSVAEIEGWDTPRLLDAIEYEQIQSDIERYRIQHPEQ